MYEKLCKLAAANLSKEKPGQTIQPTVLAHEAYVRLADGHAAQQRNSGRSWDKGHSLRMPPCQHPT
jgi:ECF sigma factor